MESFSQKAKLEILSNPLESTKNAFYEMYALLIFSCTQLDHSVFLAPHESTLVTSRIITLSKTLAQTNNKFNNVKIKYNSEFGQKEINIFLPFEVNFQNTKNIPIEDLFIHSFLRGAFLACASIVNPENEYHLEFCISSEKLKDILLKIIDCSRLNFEMKTIYRRNAYVVYSKSAEKITDFLVFIGAKKCAMDLMQVKMIKEVRNNVNRTTNFETANITKITNSAANQIEAIKKIKKHKKFEELTTSLQEIANLRIENPYSSLDDLSKKSGSKITKSGVNHRLQKIINIAKELA
ncbi:MAG: DNA-binding protein WhiA [Clostridia bacterium]|nr:DNA-binding protein WhiA [Clostridia bacterium]